MERHRLYYRYETKATNEVVKSQISNMRAEIFTHVIIFKMKADFEDDIAKIISRLDDLETKVNDLSQRK